MYNSEHWRKQGNAAYGVADFQQAVEHYSTALTFGIADGAHTLLSNRSCILRFAKMLTQRRAADA